MNLAVPVLCKCSKKLELEESQKIRFSPELLSSLEALLLEVHADLRPRPNDDEHRKQLVHRLDEMAKDIFGNTGGFPIVEAFGSFVMDMYTANSDLDLSINFSYSSTTLFPRDKKINVLKKFAKVLRAHQRKGSVHSVLPILKARVPIIKFVDCDTGVECDISVENKDGVVKSLIVLLISSIDERFQILSSLMKLWAKAHEINSSKDHTLNSLSVILLVIFHLQTRDPPILPPLSALLEGGMDLAKVENAVRRFKHFGRANKETIAELFVALLCKLSAAETLWQQGICASAYEGTWISKEWGSGVGIMSVEDFTDRTQNCARAVKEKEFKKIYECIRATINQLSRYAKGLIEIPDLKKLFGPVTLHPQEQVIRNVIGLKREPPPQDLPPPELGPTPKKRRHTDTQRRRNQAHGPVITEKRPSPSRGPVTETGLISTRHYQSHGNVHMHNRIAPFLPPSGPHYQHGPPFFPSRVDHGFRDLPPPFVHRQSPYDPYYRPQHALASRDLSYGLQYPQQEPYLPSRQGYMPGFRPPPYITPQSDSRSYHPNSQPYLPSRPGYMPEFRPPPYIPPQSDSRSYHPNSQILDHIRFYMPQFRMP